MKKFSTYLASALLTLVVFTSCSSDPLEIKAEDLKEPCDFVEAMEDILDEGLELFNSVDGDLSKLSEADQKRGEALQEKSKELDKAARERNIDVSDCEDYEALMKKMMEMGR
jgi:hypothetical protein